MRRLPAARQQMRSRAVGMRGPGNDRAHLQQPRQHSSRVGRPRCTKGLHDCADGAKRRPLMTSRSRLQRACHCPLTAERAWGCPDLVGDTLPERAGQLDGIIDDQTTNNNKAVQKFPNETHDRAYVTVKKILETNIT